MVENPIECIILCCCEFICGVCCAPVVHREPERNVNQNQSNHYTSISLNHSTSQANSAEVKGNYATREHND